MYERLLIMSNERELASIADSDNPLIIFS